jgi:hypothetical protein
MPKDFPVILTNPDLELCMKVAIKRQERNAAAGRENYNSTQFPYIAHLQGAWGECAAAKLLNLEWNIGTFSSRFNGDVGDLEVRHRPNHKWDLFLHKKDDPEKLFILVTGQWAIQRVRGWLLGAEGMIDSHWGTVPKQPHRPAYWIKPTYLHDMRSLPTLETLDIVRLEQHLQSGRHPDGFYDNKRKPVQY